MKRTTKILAVLLVFAAIVAVLVYSNRTEEPAESEVSVVQPDPEPEEPAYPTVDLTDHGRLYDVYLRPFHMVGILSYSWENYAGVRPDQLAQVYVVLNDTSSWTEPDWNVPGEDVEATAANYLQFPVDHLRSASLYDADSQAYKLSSIGTPAYVNITDATQEEDILILTFESLDPADNLTPTGSSVVTIHLKGSGFTYLSCAYTPVEDLSYTGPLDDLLAFMGPEWLAVLAMILILPIYVLRRRKRSV